MTGQRNQPVALQRVSAQRRLETVKLVARALAECAAMQREMEPHKRQYPDAMIIAAARKLDPQRRLTPGTLRSNINAAQLIAEARGYTCIENILRFGNWYPPKRNSKRWRRNRIDTLTAWTKQQLAAELTGLGEIIRHFEDRLQVIEAAHWGDGPWPGIEPYPLQPFHPGPLVQSKLLEYQNRQWTKKMLITHIISSERVASELYARLLVFDEQYVDSESLGIG